jgi:hypothetical protein
MQKSNKQRLVYMNETNENNAKIRAKTIHTKYIGEENVSGIILFIQIEFAFGWRHYCHNGFTLSLHNWTDSTSGERLALPRFSRLRRGSAKLLNDGSERTFDRYDIPCMQQ